MRKAESAISDRAKGPESRGYEQRCLALLQELRDLLANDQFVAEAEAELVNVVSLAVVGFEEALEAGD